MNEQSVDKAVEAMGRVYDLLAVLLCEENDALRKDNNVAFTNEARLLLEYALGYLEAAFRELGG